MMEIRVLKFRQPITKFNGEFIEWHYWNVKETPAIQQNGLDTREFSQQFTGLTSTDECNMIPKDCYFGDIIRFFTTDGDERICEVLWYEHEHCIGFKRLSDGFIYTQRHFNDSGYFQPSKIQFEIIGNIYETPDTKNK